LYSFYLPVAAAMLVAGVKQRSQFTTAREICCHIGEYFQVLLNPSSLHVHSPPPPQFLQASLVRRNSGRQR
jgi:hypothetical protein